MSSLVLRSLLLPENNKYQSTTGSSRLQSLSSDNAESQDNQNQSSSLSRLDSLRLSIASSPSTKGRVPIQLISPDEIDKPDLNTSYAPNNRDKSTSKLAGLTGLSNKSTAPKPVLHSLNTTTSYSASYNSNVSTSYSQVSGSKKILGNYNASVSSSVSFVDGTDTTSEKLANAIEKINIWDRKVGILNAEYDKQQSKTFNGDPSVLVDRTVQLAKAKMDATNAKADAEESYKDAVQELTSHLDNSSNMAMSIPKLLSENAQYKGYTESYDQMQKMFSRTTEKDRTTMQKVMGYLKNTLTSENFGKVLTFLNPLSEK